MELNQADYDQAEEYCRKSLYYVKKTYGENAVEICSALNQLGAILQKKDDHENTIRLFKQSYDIRKNLYGEDNLYTSISLRNYAKALLCQGRAEDLNRGGEYLLSVKDFRENLAKSGEGLGWLAQIYLDLSDYYVKMKETKTAFDYLQKSNDLYKVCGTTRDISTCELQKGKIYFTEGKLEEAEQAFQEALKISKEYYKEDHPYIRNLQSLIEKCE